MVSLLESAIRKQVASAFKGRLLPGTLRRVSSTAVDARGNPVPGPATTFAFEGIRDSFSLAFAAAAGIPVTDARILILLGSITPATDPQQDDQVKIRAEWFQLRAQVEADPAAATQVWAGFKIGDPTA